MSGKGHGQGQGNLLPEMYLKPEERSVFCAPLRKFKGEGKRQRPLLHRATLPVPRTPPGKARFNLKHF